MKTQHVRLVAMTLAWAALLPSSSGAFAQDTKSTPPLAADLKLSDKMVVAPPLDTKADIKLNAKPLRQHIVKGKENPCGKGFPSKYGVSPGVSFRPLYYPNGRPLNGC